MDWLTGALIVCLAGFIMGTVPWPFKVIKTLKFEHIWFIAMGLGLVVLPWTITLFFCPDPFGAYKEVDPAVLVKANLFAVAWGIANVLGGLCFVRIGVALTNGILTGLGVSVGVTLPMVVKGTGLFANAPDLGSRAGIAVVLGVVVMLVGVVLVSMAGFGRDRTLKQVKSSTTDTLEETVSSRAYSPGNFVGGLIMAAIAGVVSCGISLAFVYSQGPIVEAMTARGASIVPANISVWAIGLMGGALVNLLYPAYLMTKNRSWGLLKSAGPDILFSALLGCQFLMAVALMGSGMVMLGVLGASIGFGIQQAVQILGGQVLGFSSGEWRGVHGTPRLQMYSAIALLIFASIIMAYGNTLSGS